MVLEVAGSRPVFVPKRPKTPQIPRIWGVFVKKGQKGQIVFAAAPWQVRPAKARKALHKSCIYPELYIPKTGTSEARWPIRFSCLHPITGKLQRVKVYDDLNRIANLAQRQERAKELVAFYRRKLKNGWNDFSQNSRWAVREVEPEPVELTPPRVTITQHLFDVLNDEQGYSVTQRQEAPPGCSFSRGASCRASATEPERIRNWSGQTRGVDRCFVTSRGKPHLCLMVGRSDVRTMRADAAG